MWPKKLIRFVILFKRLVLFWEVRQISIRDLNKNDYPKQQFSNYVPRRTVKELFEFI